jgi:hypothetical protein
MRDTRLGRTARRLQGRWRVLRARGEAGMATAEYAIGTLAAVAFAGLLLAILRSEQVRSLLLGIIQSALSVGG